jgi:Ca2+-binding EF-hand superfamily protein
MFRILVLVWTLGLLLSACASTSPQTQASGGNFAALCRNIDTNHDGKISREEFLAAAKNKEEAATIFDMCDVEKQGSITYEQAYREDMLQEVIRLTTPRH